MEKTNNIANNQGTMRPFAFEHLPIRGRLVRIPNITDQINALELGDTSLAHTLSEMLIAAVVLAFDMKDNANITLQITTSGEVPLLLAKCNYKGVLRAFAKKETGTETTISPQHEKNSIFTITVDYGRDEPAYQSIVPLEETSISKAIEDYFQKSAQLKTLFKVFSDTDKDGRTSCGGMFLQALETSEQSTAQTETEIDIQDNWRRMQLLLATLHAHEVLPGEVKEIELLSRIFAEDDVRVFHKQDVGFAESTNRERMAEALKSLGVEECRTLMAQENGKFTMTDEYTGQSEAFTEEDMQQIFAKEWQK